MSTKHLKSALLTLPLEIEVDRRWLPTHEDYEHGCYHNQITLRLGLSRATFEYWQGSANRDYPTRTDLLESIFLEYSYVEAFSQYELYQESPDYRDLPLTLRQWKTIHKNAKNLRHVLGAQHFTELRDEFERFEED